MLSVDVRVGVTDQFIIAIESDGVVEICVDISAEIARPFPFTLTTHNGTATGDYIDSRSQTAYSNT